MRTLCSLYLGAAIQGNIDAEKQRMAEIETVHKNMSLIQKIGSQANKYIIGGYAPPAMTKVIPA